MRYIAAIDYEHLDNGMFLTALARSISQQQNVQPIIIHGESEYTNRIMQTGVMREDATVRSIKGLNHRLINLFADEGVSAVGINGHQRKLITLKGGNLHIDSKFFDNLPAGPALLISTLVWDAESSSPQPIALTRLLNFLREEFACDAAYAFNKADENEIFVNNNPDQLQWQNLEDKFIEKNLPKEFTDYGKPLRLTNVRDFSNLQNDNHAISIS